MACDSCTDKEKQLMLQKLYADAKTESEKEQASIAICEGENEYYLLNAFEAYKPGNVHRVLDVIHFMPQDSAQPFS